jgi:Fe-S cluster assembly protein SufD
MMVVAEEKEGYVKQQSRLEKQLADKSLRPLREAGLDQFQEMDFPTSRNEDWKFTSVAPLVKVPFELGPKAVGSSSLRQRITAEHLPNAIRLVFLNGRFAPDLSTKQEPQGITVGRLATLAGKSELVEDYLGKLADGSDHIFTALNTAFLSDGAVVLLPRGKVLTEPIQLLLVTMAEGKRIMSHPRTLVVAGANSQATIIETYLSAGTQEDVYFTNAVTEIAVGENAVIDHTKVQKESIRAFHIANTQIHQARSSNFSSHYVALGGGLARNETRIVFDGEGSEATLNGLYLAGGVQHLDNFTVIDHAKPHCASHELYKGILDGKAHGVFNGKIFVRQDAQKTDAKQTNQVLLLSDDATINTKPQLEIFADDVKCTHGATVGQLDAESVFYLRSRGIGLEDARGLLTFAFANDIISRLKVEAIREQLEKLLTGRHSYQGMSAPEGL